MVMELAVEEVFGARQVERLRHEYRSRPVPADPEHREKFVRVMAERFECEEDDGMPKYVRYKSRLGDVAKGIERLDVDVAGP